MGRRPERPCGSDHMWSYKLLRAMVFTQLIGEATQAEQGWYGVFPFNDIKGPIARTDTVGWEESLFRTSMWPGGR